MGNADTRGQLSEMSPRLLSQVAGACYLLNFVTGGVALFASSRLFVRGEAATTSANLLAHPSLFWLGFAAYVLVAATYIAVTALFYELFKVVNRSVSLLAAFFSLVGCAIVAVACLFYLAPYALLADPQPAGFTVEQVQAQALVWVGLFGRCFNLSFPFFGFYCLLIGYLAFRSGFLPRFVGILMMLAGLGWLTFLVPPAAKTLSPYILAPGILGEGSLTLWLLLAGVDAERWKERAGGST